MSSDLFVFDDSFFSDPFSFNFNIDSPIDILQAITNQNSDEIETNSSDQISPAILCSSSPPNSQLENLSLSQTTHLENSSNSANGHANSSSLDVKTEEFQFPVHSAFDSQRNCVPYSYGSTETTMKMMQRSYSSHSFDGNPSFIYQPQFGTLMESPNFSGQLKKACSTGDLHKMKRSYRESSIPLKTESSFMEETISKVEPYSAQERKQRIHRYRQKRNQRNFNKTIKYACRKTLADNRARIRGRFARNDETAEIPKASVEDGQYLSDFVKNTTEERWGEHHY